MSMGQPISVESSLIAENISNLQVKPSTSEIMTEQNTPELSEIERMSILNPEIAIVMTPPESVRDQIHFIVNNIAKNNVEAKSVELKALLLAEHFSWFAHYLVVKRISTQLNLHSLYISVIDLLESEEMSKILLDCVFHNVTKLLQSSKITTSTSERSILRNLGTWLGQVTLARNKPLLQRRIDLKELLFWGYESGRLIAVCSFVAKIIEGCRDSKVFRPPNPWLMAILGVMRELYELEDLKMNIKFEVQVLCNNINVKMEDIPRGISLNNRILPKKDKNPDFNVKAGAPGSTSPLTSAPVTPVLPVNTILSPSPTPLASLPPTMRSYTEEIPEKQLPVASDSLSEQTVIPNLSSHVIVNPALAFFVKNPNYRRIVSLAMDRAIREMIQPVVERCSTIACVTMKQLILKDFLAEPNESHLRTAAQLMITNLAGSLALVTCKEPLRISIGNHLRSLLSQVLNDTANVEQIVQVCSNDNIDLGCKLIEKAATERAIRGE
jgi:CCR4-NOT transcription complex subunit 1